MDTVNLPNNGSLSHLPLFEGLSGQDLQRLAASLQEIHFRGRCAVFKRGYPARGLYVVITGQVKLSLETPQGGEQVVEVVGPGGNLGETALILGDPHVLSAETLEDCRLLFMPKSVVMAEFERTPDFTRAMVRALSRRLQYLIGALENCTLRNGTERVIGYLLNRLPPEATNGPAQVLLPAKKGIIASQLNLTHEHFSRILRSLATAAMIEVDGRTVHIADVGRLRAGDLQA